jgi:hypothetical protein
MTIEELLETYESIADRRTDEMEFMAKINGADFKRSSPPPAAEESQEKEKSPGLVERLKLRKESEQQSKALSGQKTNFSEGVGYQVIR